MASRSAVARLMSSLARSPWRISNALIFQCAAFFLFWFMLIVFQWYWNPNRAHFRESATNDSPDIIFDFRIYSFSNLNIRQHLRKGIFGPFVVKKDLFGRIGGLLFSRNLFSSYLFLRAFFIIFSPFDSPPAVVLIAHFLQRITLAPF